MDSNNYNDSSSGNNYGNAGLDSGVNTNDGINFLNVLSSINSELRPSANTLSSLKRVSSSNPVRDDENPHKKLKSSDEQAERNKIDNLTTGAGAGKKNPTITPLKLPMQFPPSNTQAPQSLSKTDFYHLNDSLVNHPPATNRTTATPIRSATIGKYLSEYLTPDNLELPPEFRLEARKIVQVLCSKGKLPQYLARSRFGSLKSSEKSNIVAVWQQLTEEDRHSIRNKFSIPQNEVIINEPEVALVQTGEVTPKTSLVNRDRKLKFRAEVERINFQRRPEQRLRNFYNAYSDLVSSHRSHFIPPSFLDDSECSETLEWAVSRSKSRSKTSLSINEKTENSP
jgi:hypothetical protein